jgi:membrane protease YdiL (CAAX protease family)
VRRYSSRQLLLAKCAITAVIGVIGGLAAADDAGKVPITILVVSGMVAIAIGAYEALSHGLAVLLGRSWNDGFVTPGELTGMVGARAETPGHSRAHPGTLRRRDVATAFLAYLAGQAVVWTIVGVIAATRTGQGGDRSDLLKAISAFIPIALPGSLVAGAIALLLVLGNWRKRLGNASLGSLLGLSWGAPRQVLNGVLAGAALAMFVLPLMSLMAERPEPPDLLTQLAGSSRAALLAWMISAVLLAPPIEELMFRGALLGGLADTGNIRAAALISGAMFWLMHGPEFVHWPAAVAIGLLTILATALRLRHRSLGPAIAAHFGYNLVLAGVISIAMFAGPEKARWA